MELELDGVNGADAGALTVRGRRCDYLLTAVMRHRASVLLSAAVMPQQDRLLQACVGLRSCCVFLPICGAKRHRRAGRDIPQSVSGGRRSETEEMSTG